MHGMLVSTVNIVDQSSQFKDENVFFRPRMHISGRTLWRDVFQLFQLFVEFFCAKVVVLTK